MVLVDARESAIYIGRRDRPKFCHVYSGKLFFHHHHHEAKSFDGFFFGSNTKHGSGWGGVGKTFLISKGRTYSKESRYPIQLLL